MSMDRERRKTSAGTRVLNTPISEDIHRALKAESRRQRKAMGVLIDERFADLVKASPQPQAGITSR